MENNKNIKNIDDAINLAKKNIEKNNLEVFKFSFGGSNYKVEPIRVNKKYIDNE